MKHLKNYNKINESQILIDISDSYHDFFYSSLSVIEDFGGTGENIGYFYSEPSSTMGVTNWRFFKEDYFNYINNLSPEKFKKSVEEDGLILVYCANFKYRPFGDIRKIVELSDKLRRLNLIQNNESKDCFQKIEIIKFTEGPDSHIIARLTKEETLKIGNNLQMKFPKK